MDITSPKTSRLSEALIERTLSIFDEAAWETAKKEEEGNS